MTYKLHHGDCLEVMRGMADNSVDSIVTDPPYGLNFMGKDWDHGVPGGHFWAEMLRVLKPGGHLLAFAGTRTQHRMATNIEDGGFEIRDMIAWMYGSGFPKSMDVSKAIDKAAGAERGTAYIAHGGNKVFSDGKGKAAGVDRTPGVNLSDPPATDAARQWEGWGTALKPALEPITVARKPLSEKTVAANVLQHGTGGINIDGCRVEGRERTDYGLTNSVRSKGSTYGEPSESADFDASKGRFPANLIHDGSPEVMSLFPDSNGSGGSVPQVKITGYGDKNVGNGKSEYIGGERTKVNSGTGSAARFFYCAKANKKDRGENDHPTVKPTELMRYLCRLVTPPGGVVLDPFMGSGSTGKAAMLEGFRFIGIEQDEGYMEIARARIGAVTGEDLI